MPNEEPDVAAYIEDFSPRAPSRLNDDGRLIVVGDAYDAAHMHETPAQLHIVPFELAADVKSGFVRSAPLAQSDTTNMAAICKSIDLALEQQKTICIILRPETLFPYDSQKSLPGHERNTNVTAAEENAVRTFHQNVPTYRYILSAGLLIQRTTLQTNIYARADEIRPFLKKYGVCDYQLEQFQQDGMRVLAVNAADTPVAASWSVGRGRIMIMPMRHASDREDLAEELKALVRCLSTLESRTVTEEPTWVRDGFIWGGEADLRAKHTEALETIEETATALADYSRLRQILWTRDERLRLSVTDCLRELGLQIDDDDNYKEDFWILQGEERFAIGEVKGINANLSPSDLAKVVSHRKEAALSDDFPAIIVANTFANTTSVDKRRIEPNVCRRAAEDNILIVRTIDLANLLKGLKLGTPGFTVDALLQNLAGGGGWLEVTDKALSLTKEDADRDKPRAVEPTSKLE